jgi:hypothetical protein
MMDRIKGNTISKMLGTCVVLILLGAPALSLANSLENTSDGKTVPLNEQESKLTLQIHQLAYNEFNAIDKNETVTVYLRALRAWVQTADFELRKAGFAETANDLQQVWQAGLSAFELGDHRFISQKLNVLYDDIEAKLGKKFCHIMRLDDIRIVNYGYVVTIYPKGDPKTGETWDMEEYRKHFVPFTAAVTYWAARLACLIAFPEAAMVSGIILEVPRYAWEHWIGPSVSDRVYTKAISRTDSKD